MIFTLMTSKPFVSTAHAWWGFGDINWDAGNFVPNLGSFIAKLGNWVGDIGQWIWENKNEILRVLAAASIEAAKVLALKGVQIMTAEITGQDGGLIIRDWGNYLYDAPSQKALKQMDSFYNTASKGRRSSLNYEGVSGTSNISGFFVSQSKQTIAGASFQTNIQELVANPRQDLFSTGNMKGLMSTTQCANNVACFTLTASMEYDKNVAKNQEIAKAEQQNGVRPTKNANGFIDKPAALINNALMQVDEMGTKLIIDAKSDGTISYVSALAQIAEGAALSIAAKAGSYYATDAEASAAPNAAKSEYPFSLSYKK